MSEVSPRPTYRLVLRTGREENYYLVEKDCLPQQLPTNEIMLYESKYKPDQKKFDSVWSLALNVPDTDLNRLDARDTFNELFNEPENPLLPRDI